MINTELVELFDRLAGKQHSADGSARAALERILTRHEEIIRRRITAAIEAMAAERAVGPRTNDRLVIGRVEGEANGFAIAARLASGDDPRHPNVPRFVDQVMAVAERRTRERVAQDIQSLDQTVGSEWPEVAEALGAARALALGERVPPHEWEVLPRPDGLGEGPPPRPSWEKTDG